MRPDGGVPESIDPDRLPSADALLNLLRSRRSTRRFRPEAPPRSLLERLADAARFAPTGSNRQAVRIVMVTDPDLLASLHARIIARYIQYERHLASPVRRFFLATFVDRRLGTPAIRAELGRFLDAHRAGHDPLFHRAPVLVLTYTESTATTPKDDCCLALYHMVLAAERLGLGSCFLGTAELAFARTPSLNDLVRIPRDRTVLGAACFGYPAIRFERLVDREPPRVQWLG